MNRLKAVLQSKSANAPPRRGTHKKSWSSGEVSRLASKKRGVYVQNKHPSQPTGAVDKPHVAKRPPKSQKEFLNSVLTILSQETAGTQFPENNKQDAPTTSHRRVRVRKRIAMATADMGTQDLDAVYSDHSQKDNTSPHASADTNKPIRRKRFRSRALNSNLNENLELDDPVEALQLNMSAVPCTPSKANAICKTVLDGQKILDSKNNQSESGPMEPPTVATTQVEQDTSKEPVISFEEPPVEDPPVENPSEDKPKRSKVRIVEPILIKKKYDDEPDKQEATEKKSYNQFYGPPSTTGVYSQRGYPNDRLDDSKTDLDDYNYVMTPNVREKLRQRDLSFNVPVVDFNDNRNYMDFDVSDLNNVEVYTAVSRMHTQQRVRYEKPYDDAAYARLCNMRSKAVAARKQFEARQSRPARTRVYSNQEDKKSTRYNKSKGKNHPLLEQLRRELTLEPDWFVEPDNMHDALLKVMNAKKRARQSIKFPESRDFRDFEQSECMIRGRKKRVIPAAPKLYKPKVVGTTKGSFTSYDGHKKLNYRHKNSDSVIMADITPDEQEMNLYVPLEAPLSLSVQNYEYHADDTPLQRIYLSGEPEDVDSLSSKEVVRKSAHQQHYIEIYDQTESTLTSDTTLRMLTMTPQALDYL